MDIELGKLELVFKGEYKTLKEIELVLNKKDIDFPELNEAYSKLAGHYSDLLQEFVKITKISDINQKKLFDSYNEVEKQKVILYKAATVDQLSNIYNRAFLMESLETEFERSKRFNETFACILFDIDDFKQVNDTYGHQMGDVVIENIAGIASDQIRSTDILGRYGGEEFMIIMPNTDFNGASIIAEKIRESIMRTDFSLKKNRVNCTISLGVTDSNLGDHKDSDDVLFKADTALYQAKAEGKNKFVVYNPKVVC
ncbi:GGDEF domain-containing protein [sulfur-oxidizing endosymbiont of Gigantopelta aegis]|uniref:GGDEF domain-containing protein n=1 Tax=sulfur-oxidizing endosymbiont of Gigantopelta aegis TaxID=2794934 RepID=UPI0018DC2079|nr:GGDEF domain-containing protein [sulfur-oxidizing endosymbiont of Gigantopelta aegis]